MRPHPARTWVAICSPAARAGPCHRTSGPAQELPSRQRRVPAATVSGPSSIAARRVDRSCGGCRSRSPVPRCCWPALDVLATSTAHTVLDVVQDRRLRQWVRWGLLAVIVAVGLWAFLALITAVLDKISLEPTDAAHFRAWTVAPQAEAGGIAAALVVVAVVCWAFAGRRPRLQTIAAVVVLVGVVALVWGTFERRRRSHPETARGRALAAVV